MYYKEVNSPKVCPVISATVGKGKSIIVASRGKKPSLLAEGLVSDSSSSRPYDEERVRTTLITKTPHPTHPYILRAPSPPPSTIHQPPVQQLLHSTHRTPKLRPLPPSNHRPLTVRSQRRPHKIKSTDKSLTIRGIQAVFWGFAHGDDEDVAIVAVEGEIWGVND
jgi:hypothetical protein